MREKVFCLECCEKQTFSVRTARETITVRGVNCTYSRETAYCDRCGKEIYVPAVNDANVQAREDAYKSASNNP